MRIATAMMSTTAVAVIFGMTGIHVSINLF
jgi:hypothetical protein